MSMEEYRKIIDGLTPEQAREQLLLALEQMARCRDALRGLDAEPVQMMDEFASIDLELFYRCRMMAAEMRYLEGDDDEDEDEDEDVDVDDSVSVSAPLAALHYYTN